MFFFYKVRRWTTQSQRSYLTFTQFTASKWWSQNSIPVLLVIEKQVSYSSLLFLLSKSQKDARLMLCVPSYLSFPCLKHGTVTCLQKLNVYWEMLKRKKGPGCRGSVDWAPAWEPKGLSFNSQSGHMPGLQARSPVGDKQKATTHWCFSSSLSPSIFLSKNK